MAIRYRSLTQEQKEWLYFHDESELIFDNDNVEYDYEDIEEEADEEEEE